MGVSSRDLASRISLRQLRVIAAIGDHGSIRLAAQSVNVTQPTATKALKEAEAALGAQLFTRTNRGVVPTAIGEAVCRRARLVLAEVRQAAEEVSDLKEGLGGRVSVGSLLAASARLLPEAIARLRRARPKVSVHVVEGTNDVLMPALRMGQLDLVVGRLSEFRERSALRQEVLYDEITCLAVRPGHPILGRPAPTLRDTLDWDFILPRPETTLRRQLEKAFHDEGLEPPAARIESVSVLTNRHLAMETDAISVWPHQVVRRDLLDGLLVRLPLQLWQASGPVGVSLRASGPTSPVAAAMLEELRSVAAAIREERQGEVVFM